MKIPDPKKRNGFTFIELLVAVTIIGIMAAASMTTLRNQSGRARDTRRKADLEQIRTALEFHRKRFGQYPNTAGLGRMNPNYGDNFGWLGICDNYDANLPASGFVPDLVPDFIGTLPQDPRTGQPGISCATDTKSSCYLYRSDGAQFKLLAHCTNEQVPDPDDPYFDPCRPEWAFQVNSGGQEVRGTGLPCRYSNPSADGW